MARAYANPDHELVRVAICGAVDSGKSTLLGRLVVDADLAYADEPGGIDDDLALLADGLEAEAEQGITIDVAYRHFFTDRRSYLFADAPGHAQYTGNMATAASDADAGIVVVDAVVGLEDQTRRHLAVLALMRVPHVIACVNKVDAVDDAPARFAALADEVRAHARAVGLAEPTVLPIAARNGANVTAHPLPWFDGPTLVEALDAVTIDDPSSAPLRLPVRLILRPDSGVRWISGTVATGTIGVGDAVGIAGRPLREGPLRVVEVATARGAVDRVSAREACRIRVDRHVDVSRGDVLCAPEDVETGLAQGADVQLLWLHEIPLVVGRRYIVRAGTRWMFGRVTEVTGVLDPSDLTERPPAEVGIHDIARARIAFAQPLPLDTFAEHAPTGALILTDPATGDTVAAATVLARDVARRSAIRETVQIDRAERAALFGHGGVVAWFTGLSGSGKSTITRRVEAELFARGHAVTIVDGDNLRLGLCGDLTFSPDDRTENLRRAAEVARLMLDAGLIVLCEFVSPMAIDRQEARRIVGTGDFLEIHVHASVETCIERDPKGLYQRALAGEITDFTGIGAPYEPPAHPDLRLDTEHRDVDACVAAAVELIEASIQPARMPSVGD